jgi:hypothetical protein
VALVANVASSSSSGLNYGLSTAPFQGGPSAEANFESIISQRFESFTYWKSQINPVLNQFENLRFLNSNTSF